MKPRHKSVILTPVLLFTVLNGCCEKPAPPAGGVVSVIAPKVQSAALEMQSETGPGKLYIQFDRKQVPDSKSLTPGWASLRGPFTPTDKEGEFSAPVDMDMKTVRSWFHEEKDGAAFWTWPDRFEKPLPFHIPPPPPLALTFPWFLRLDMITRITQDPLPYPIDKRKSLLVIDTDVVNDPGRTWDPALSGVSPATPAGNQYGIWSFHHLVSCLANEQYTGVSPSALVGSWIDTWKSDQRPEGSQGNTATARISSPGTELLAHWPRLPGTVASPTSAANLDTTRAPFRLLAIVNRFDLRESSLYGGGGRKAELRFVFCSVKTYGSEAGDARDFLVIFEFGVPLKKFPDVHAYARKWTDLSDPALSRDEYRRKLADITESVVAPVPGSPLPNRSNLNQVRTEEQYFVGVSSDWEFREFVLNGTSHLLEAHTVAQTPDPWVNTQYDPLCKWVGSHADAVKEGRYVLPVDTQDLWVVGTHPEWSGLPKKLHGAMAREGASTDWFGNGSIQDCDAVTRQAFIRNTCNGCHSDGTPNFRFVKHISPRRSDRVADTSPFLFTEDPQPDIPPNNRPDDLDQRLDKLKKAAEASPLLPFDELFLLNVPQPH